MVKRIILFFNLASIFISCVDFESPLDIGNTESLITFNSKRTFPYLILDNENNAIIFYKQDTLQNISDRKWSGIKILLKKYDQYGNILVDEKTLIRTVRFIEFGACWNNNDLCIIWFDAKDYPDFKSSSHHTHYVDVYYKRLNKLGDVIQNEKKMNTIFVHKDYAMENFILSPVYYGTLDDLNTEAILYDTTSHSRVFIDSKKDQHYFTLLGNHIADSTQLFYEKYDELGNILVDKIELAKFKKIPGHMWGPSILYLQIEIDPTLNIHVTWRLNDGTSLVFYYYLKISRSGKIIFKNIIGEGKPEVWW